MSTLDSRLAAIRGSKGKGGKKGGGGENAENTLRSKGRARIIEVISEGVIEGLVNGEESIYFDQTPLKNPNGTYNFKNVLWEEHKGLPDEGYFNGHSAVESPESVEVQVKFDTGPVQRTIVDENADAVRIIMRLPSLVAQDKDSGKLQKTSVSYAIDVRAYNGTWVEKVKNQIKNEKTTSAYQIAHRVDLPLNGSPWDVRVRRLTTDSTKDTLQNDTWWESYVVLTEGKFTYPHTAAVALGVNAEDMGQSIPARSYHVKGIKIEVPSNYDPIARTYEGIWDGTFKVAWSNCPPWIFRDIIVNDRYGLGEFIDADLIDKWSLYTIAQYCDQMIKSGYKNGDTGEDIYEPRFTFNGAINTRDDAYFVLQQISRAWRGMAYWSLGQVFATADMPADPIKLVAPANVIDGEFSYAGTAMKARHSVCVVKWNDPSDFYRPAPEVVIDPEALRRFGWREKSLQLTGCTSRGLAHRYGKWVLDVEQNETETIEYKASWDHAEVRPGDLIAVADPQKAQVRLGGRIVRHLDNVVELDYDFEAREGEVYAIMLAMPDGSIERRTIATFKDPRTVVVTPAFPVQASPNAMFAITGTDIVPRQYRVLAIEEAEKNIFKITALFHDPNKYARVEQDVAFNPLPYTRPINVSSQVKNISVQETGYIENGVAQLSINVSWSPPTDQLYRGFLVNVETPTDGFVNMGITGNSSVELLSAERGDYRFYVSVVSLSGVVGEAVEFFYTAIGYEGYALPTVSNLELVDRAGSDEFIGSALGIQWRNNFATATSPIAEGGTPQNVITPHYAYNIVKVFDAGSNTLLRQSRVVGEAFIYTLEMNQGDNLAAGRVDPSRSLRIELTVFDVFGRVSETLSRVFSNTVPEAVAPTYNVVSSTVHLTYPPILDPDFAGLLIWRSTAPNINVANTAPIYDSKNNPITITGEEDTTYYFKVAAYDAFGKTGLNYSTEFSLLTGREVDIQAPDRPEGLELAVRVETVDGVAQRIVLTASVDLNVEADFVYYDFEIRQGTGNYVAFSSATPTYEWDVMPEQTYSVRVRAVDKSGNGSARTDAESIETPEVPELAHLINSGTTAIEPGMIRISGATMLSDWRRGGDETKINGGAVSANSIEANSLTIGQRGVHLEGIEFEHNEPGPNQVSWTSGEISFIDDDGSDHLVAVASGVATFTSQVIYLFWTKGSPVVTATTSRVDAFQNTNIVLAIYRGDRDLIAEYGRTVIDGSKIKTGTIVADQIAANAIEADKIKVDNLSAIAADMGEITAGVLKSFDGKFVIDLNNKTISIEV